MKMDPQNKSITAQHFKATKIVLSYKERQKKVENVV